MTSYSKSLVKFVNSRTFTYSWIVFSLLMLGFTAFSSYKGFSLIFALTLVDGLTDIYLEHHYSIGVTRKLTFVNLCANLLGVVVQSMYGLYGGAVTSFIGFMLLSHKFLTWDSAKDGKVTSIRKQEVTLTTLGVLFGIIALSVIYGFLFRGSQPLWLVGLNVLVFFLGTTGRILLINGKVESQYIYLVRELTDISIFIAMILLGLASGSFWIRLSSHISSLIILFKGVVNWRFMASANEEKL